MRESKEYETIIIYSSKSLKKKAVNLHEDFMKRSLFSEKILKKEKSCFLTIQFSVYLYLYFISSTLL